MTDNSGLVVAALLATDPELAGSIDAQNSWKNDLVEIGARVALFREYEEGEHRSGITDQMRKMLRLPVDETGITEFNDNYCEIIVEKMAGRLYVAELSTKDETIDEQWLEPLLERTKWEALQGSVFRAAVRDGESFIMVDPGTLLWTSEATYDGWDGIVAIMEQNSSTPKWACKLWAEAVPESQDDDFRTTMRIVVYQPDRISYWWGDAGEKEVKPLVIDMGNGFGEVAEYPWVLTQPPLVRFVNKQNNYSTEGRSELRPAIPLQDTLNRTLHSMVMSSEFAAFRVAYSIGLEMNAEGIIPGAIICLTIKDEAGNISISPEAAAFLAAVSVGQLEATDIGQYINQIDRLAKEVSQVTQTPIYGVTTEGVLSGEALKQLEIGLIGKCVRFQRDNSDPIRTLVKLTAEMQDTFDTEVPGPAPEIDAITVKWQSPELLDSTQQIAALTTLRKDAPGLFDDAFYRQRIGELLGMSSDDIDSEGNRAVEGQFNLFSALSGAGGTNLPPA